MAEKYTNKEIDLMFKNILQRIDEHHKLQMIELSAIKEQTIKTNGRVSVLEESDVSKKRDITKLFVDQSNAVGEIGFLMKEYQKGRDKELTAWRKIKTHMIWAVVFILWIILQTTGLVNLAFPF